MGEECHLRRLFQSLECETLPGQRGAPGSIEAGQQQTLAGRGRWGNSLSLCALAAPGISWKHKAAFIAVLFNMARSGIMMGHAN